MSEHDELRDLLTDAVSDVEPRYRLDTIRARTQRRPFHWGWRAVGVAALASTAVVTTVAVLNGPDHGPVPGPPASEAPRVAGLYFVGETPEGPRLYREWRLVSGGPIADLRAITEAEGPIDPDYSTLWPAGIFEAVEVRDGVIAVELGEWTGPTYDIDPALVHAYLQAVVYTAQAATATQLPVQFTADGEPAREPFGVLRGRKPIQRDPQNDVLALVSVSDPAEGTRVSGSFMARGRANSNEANVPWEIRDGDDRVVAEGFATADGWMDRLYEWETKVDVSRLEPGRYTFVAMTEDPSGGAEGNGPTYDTRTIVVE